MAWELIVKHLKDMCMVTCLRQADLITVTRVLNRHRRPWPSSQTALFGGLSTVIERSEHELPQESAALEGSPTLC
jgi:hypothetical protein